MFEPSFLSTPIFQYVLLPLLIFCARVCDVSISTIRLILLYRGRRVLAPVLGFIEVLIWLLAMRQIMSNLTNPFIYIGFAGGFAMGNYVGIILEEKLAESLGTRVTIEPREKGGKISIDYFTHDELMALSALIKGAGVNRTHQGMFDKITVYLPV